MSIDYNDYGEYFCEKETIYRYIDMLFFSQRLYSPCLIDQINNNERGILENFLVKSKIFFSYKINVIWVENGLLAPFSSVSMQAIYQVMKNTIMQDIYLHYGVFHLDVFFLFFFLGYTWLVKVT